MKPNRQFYTYVLIRPDGTPFYVGKGFGRRYKDCGGNKHVLGVRDKILSAGEKIGLCLIPAESEEEAFKKEIELIALYGREDKGLGPLCNMTDGGEGASGGPSHEFTLEHRKAQSELIKRQRQDPEFVRKQREAARLQVGDKNPFYGKQHSEEIKTRLSELAYKRLEDADVRATHLAKLNSPEARQKNSIRMKANNPMKNSEVYNRVLSGLNTPRAKENHRRAMAKRSNKTAQSDAFSLDSLPEPRK